MKKEEVDNAIIFHVFRKKVPPTIEIEIPGIKKAPLGVAPLQKKVPLTPLESELLANLDFAQMEVIYGLLGKVFRAGLLR